MVKKGTSVQLIAMFAIILVMFFGSALFFSTLNTDTMRSAMRAEADLSSSLLSSALNTQVPEEQVRSGELSMARLHEVFSAGDPLGADNDVWIISGTGAVFFSSTDQYSGNFFHRYPGAQVDRELLVSARNSGVSISWLGKSVPFLVRQQCCVLRPVYQGRLFLVLINRGESVHAMQRRQFTLLLGLELVLMFVMVVLITNLITDYRQQIIRLATRDELTGLANRKSFNAQFAERMEQEQPGPRSLFLLDIDFFKQINDNYGHAAGDSALRSLSREIQALMEERGGLAGRWGGDEFIGLLPLSGREAREALADLCRRVEATPQAEGFHMTISAGVADCEGLTALGQLTERADAALYQSKASGRNRCCLYAPELAQPQTAAAPAPAPAQRSAAPAPPTAPSAGAPAAARSAEERRFLVRLRRYLRRLITSTVMGVHWMAPFVAGGGILIGLAFLFDAASVDLASLSVEARAQFGSITPLAATLKSIGGVTFNFMLPVFAGFMAYGLAGEDAFMAGFVGGYMTIDSNSGFIGAMAAGFAAGVLANEIQRFTRRLPLLVRKAAPVVIYPVFNLLLMQGLSWVLITPLSSALGRLFTGLLSAAAARSPVAEGALGGAMMAVDMGGIVNKVAYNYGVAGLESGGNRFMAAVMIGGMVPPVALFLCTLLFPQKFSQEQRDRGPLTLFMGLSFITEGALPYVFTDLGRVIPCCMAGSGLAGALCAVFGCGLPAPHGGVFVLPVMERPLPYLLALGAASLLTAVLLGMWKRPVRELSD